MQCLGFELGPQDGRRRRNHGAMVATSYHLIEQTENKLKRGPFSKQQKYKNNQKEARLGGANSPPPKKCLILFTYY